MLISFKFDDKFGMALCQRNMLFSLFVKVGGWVRTMHHEFRNDIWRCFTSNDIEGSDLKDLDEEEIFGFGVEKFRHRAILLENIEKLPTEEMLKMFEAEQSARDALAARRLSENQKVIYPI